MECPDGSPAPRDFIPAPKLVWEFSYGIAFFIGDKVGKVGDVMLLSLVFVFSMRNTSSLL